MSDKIRIVMLLIYIVIVIAIIVGFSWLIGTSNLPDWVKFVLLS